MVKILERVLKSEEILGEECVHLFKNMITGILLRDGRGTRQENTLTLMGPPCEVNDFFLICNY